MWVSSQGQILASTVQGLRAGGRCALCVVVGTRGSTPQTPGALLLLRGDGTTEGTLGGGCIEAEVRRRALALLEDGQPALLSFDLDDDYGWDDGLICGGQMQVAVAVYAGANSAPALEAAVEAVRRQERTALTLRVATEEGEVDYRLNLEPAATLLIAGAGHVGAALAKLAVSLDFRVVVLDDRADLMKPERLPSPIEAVAGDIAAELRRWPVDKNTYVVIVTRGHKHDEQALQAMISSPARYIGMIGSRRKIKIIYDDLVELGINRELLERVHAPIGLAIGAVSVPELAVSIAAELVQIRRSDSVRAVEGPFEVTT